MPLVKKVTRIGNSGAVLLDRPLLRQLNLEPGVSEVEINLSDDTITIRPHRYAGDAEALSAGKRVVDKRRKLMQRLAER